MNTQKVRGYFSTKDKDIVGDSIEHYDVKGFLENPIVLKNNDDSRVIGKCTSIIETQEGLLAEVIIYDKETIDELDKIDIIYGSIGFITKNYSFSRNKNTTLHEIEILELSILTGEHKPTQLNAILKIVK